MLLPLLDAEPGDKANANLSHRFSISQRQSETNLQCKQQTHSRREMLGNLPKTDVDICSYAGLLVELALGKVFEQLVVED